MMKKSLVFLLACVWIVGQAAGQSESRYAVHYMVSYDAGRQLYTAWVVPQYNTPNDHNGDSEEKGATAQFSLKIPAGFTVSDIRDVKGSWEKTPFKVGGQSALVKAGADARFGYYTVGKAPSETTYGAFKTGEPVALFTFRGQGGDPAEVSALEPNDPVIAVARQALSLNIGGSFYSRSGQAPTMQAKPLEQLAATTSMPQVLKDMNRRLTDVLEKSLTKESLADQAVIVYPNPVSERLQVKYFSQQDGADVRVELIDFNGTTKQTLLPVLKTGFNTIELNMALYTGGTYLLRTVEAGKVVTKKIVKNQ